MSLPKNMAATRVRRAWLATLLAAAAAPALADPADYVFTPYTDSGLWQLAYALGPEHGRIGSRRVRHGRQQGGGDDDRFYAAHKNSSRS